MWVSASVVFSLWLYSSPFWLQIASVHGSIDVHTSLFRTGPFPRWHTHPLWFLFLFLIRFFFFLALFFTVVTPTESSASPGIQSPLLVPPRTFRDLFEESEPKKSFCGFSIFLLNLGREPGFGVSGRKTDESLKRTSSQRGRLVSRLTPARIGRKNGRADGTFLRFRSLSSFRRVA